MKKFRVIGKEWCEMEAKLTYTDGKTRLSITGTAGTVIPKRSGKKMAREYWEGFFEECPEELGRMAVEYGKRTPRSAANYVLQVDGDFHGLDVHKDEDGKLYLVQCCGQIREELIRFFPDCEEYLPWHLNDMKAGCEHQEALGWGHGYTVALSPQELTPAQRATIEGRAMRECERIREKEFKEDWAILMKDKRRRTNWLLELKGEGKVTLHDVETFDTPWPTADKRKLEAALLSQIEERIKPVEFKGKVYENSLGAPCPECGYEYGTAWLYRELPPHVIAWAKGEPLPPHVEVVRKGGK